MSRIPPDAPISGIPTPRSRPRTARWDTARRNTPAVPVTSRGISVPSDRWHSVNTTLDPAPDRAGRADESAR